jgi:hypothetical protein
MRMLRSTTIAAAFLCAVGPGAVWAANINFIETATGVVVQPDANFECGVTSTSGLETATADGCWITNSPNGYSGSATAYIVEPFVPGTPPVVSDKLHIQFDVATDALGRNLAHMHWDFFSDSETAPPEFPPPNVPLLEEDGTCQGPGAYFVDAAGNRVIPPDNITMCVQSDLDTTVGVAPSSWQNVKKLYR